MGKLAKAMKGVKVGIPVAKVKKAPANTTKKVSKKY